MTLSVTKKCFRQWHYFHFHLTPTGLVAYFTIIQLPPLLLKKTSQGENNYLVQLKVVDSRRIGSHQARSKSLRHCWPSDKCMDVLQRGARTYNSALKPQSFCWWNKRSSSARKKRKRKKKKGAMLPKAMWHVSKRMPLHMSV